MEEKKSWYENAWDSTTDFVGGIASSAADFLAGTVYSVSDNYTYGLTSKISSAPNSKSSQFGQSFGNALTYAASAFEMFTGGLMFGGGVTVSPLAFAGAPITAGGTIALDAAALAGGAAMMTHGSSVAMYAATKDSNISEPYKRPNNATTPEQRQSVQGKTCVDCGKAADKMVADHKVPLVKEYYDKGAIDLKKMRSLDAIQPQCPSCSNKQGGLLSGFSKLMKNIFGF